MKCESNNTYSMGKICLEAWINDNDNETEECFPESTGVFGTITTVWYIINVSIGIMGNLLTLLAIPYAAKKKRWNFLKTFNSNYENSID